MLHLAIRSSLPANVVTHVLKGTFRRVPSRTSISVNDNSPRSPDLVIIKSNIVSLYATRGEQLIFLCETRLAAPPVAAAVIHPSWYYSAILVLAFDDIHLSFLRYDENETFTHQFVTIGLVQLDTSILPAGNNHISPLPPILRVDPSENYVIMLIRRQYMYVIPLKSTPSSGEITTTLCTLDHDNVDTEIPEESFSESMDLTHQPFSTAVWGDEDEIEEIAADRQMKVNIEGNKTKETRIDGNNTMMKTTSDKVLNGVSQNAVSIPFLSIDNIQVFLLCHRTHDLSIRFVRDIQFIPFTSGELLIAILHEPVPTWEGRVKLVNWKTHQVACTALSCHVAWLQLQISSRYAKGAFLRLRLLNDIAGIPFSATHLIPTPCDIPGIAMGVLCVSQHAILHVTIKRALGAYINKYGEEDSLAEHPLANDWMAANIPQNLELIADPSTVLLRANLSFSGACGAWYNESDEFYFLLITTQGVCMRLTLETDPRHVQGIRLDWLGRLIPAMTVLYLSLSASHHISYKDISTNGLKYFFIGSAESDSMILRLSPAQIVSSSTLGKKATRTFFESFSCEWVGIEKKPLYNMLAIPILRTIGPAVDMALYHSCLMTNHSSSNVSNHKSDLQSTVSCPKSDISDDTSLIPPSWVVPLGQLDSQSGRGNRSYPNPYNRLLERIEIESGFSDIYFPKVDKNANTSSEQVSSAKSTLNNDAANSFVCPSPSILIASGRDTMGSIHLCQQYLSSFSLLEQKIDALSVFFLDAKSMLNRTLKRYRMNTYENATHNTVLEEKVVSLPILLVTGIDFTLTFIVSSGKVEMTRTLFESNKRTVFACVLPPPNDIYTCNIEDSEFPETSNWYLQVTDGGDLILMHENGQELIQSANAFPEELMALDQLTDGTSAIFPSPILRMAKCLPIPSSLSTSINSSSFRGMVWSLHQNHKLFSQRIPSVGTPQYCQSDVETFTVFAHPNGFPLLSVVRKVEGACSELCFFASSWERSETRLVSLAVFREFSAFPRTLFPLALVPSMTTTSENFANPQPSHITQETSSSNDATSVAPPCITNIEIVHMGSHTSGLDDFPRLFALNEEGELAIFNMHYFDKLDTSSYTEYPLSTNDSKRQDISNNALEVFHLTKCAQYFLDPDPNFQSAASDSSIPLEKKKRLEKGRKELEIINNKYLSMKCYSTQIIPFSVMDGLTSGSDVGVYVCGKHPKCFLSKGNRLFCHSHVSRRYVSGFVPFHSSRLSHGFVHCGDGFIDFASFQNPSNSQPNKGKSDTTMTFASNHILEKFPISPPDFYAFDQWNLKRIALNSTPHTLITFPMHTPYLLLVSSVTIPYQHIEKAPYDTPIPTSVGPSDSSFKTLDTMPIGVYDGKPSAVSAEVSSKSQLGNDSKISKLSENIPIPLEKHFSLKILYTGFETEWQSVAELPFMEHEHVLCAQLLTLSTIARPGVSRLGGAGPGMNVGLLDGAVSNSIRNLRKKGNNDLNMIDVCAIGTAFPLGEHVVCRGRLLLVLCTLAGSTNRQTSIRTLHSEFVKGPVTSITSLHGYLVIAIGPTIKMYYYDAEREKLVLAAFYYASTYIHRLISIKQFLVIGDLYHSCQLMRWNELQRVLEPLARDMHTYSLIDVNVLYHDKAFGIVVTDEKRHLIVLGYEPVVEDVEENPMGNVNPDQGKNEPNNTSSTSLDDALPLKEEVSRFKQGVITVRREKKIVESLLRVDLEYRMSGGLVSRLLRLRSSDDKNQIQMWYVTNTGEIGSLCPVSRYTHLTAKWVLHYLQHNIQHPAGLIPRRFCGYSKDDIKQAITGKDRPIDVAVLKDAYLMGSFFERQKIATASGTQVARVRHILEEMEDKSIVFG